MHRVETSGGGGGGGVLLGKFLVGLCRWDSETLYQTTFSSILHPYSRLDNKHPYPISDSYDLYLSAIYQKHNHIVFRWKTTWQSTKLQGLNFHDCISEFFKPYFGLHFSRFPGNWYSRPKLPLNFYPRPNCLKPYSSQWHIPIIMIIIKFLISNTLFNIKWSKVQKNWYLLYIHNIRLQFKNSIYKAKKVKKGKNWMFLTN